MTTTADIMALAQSYTEAAYKFVRTSEGMDESLAAGDALRAAVESLVAERDALAEFAQGLIDDYHSDDGFDEPKAIVRAAREALRGQP